MAGVGITTVTERLTPVRVRYLTALFNLVAIGLRGEGVTTLAKWRDTMRHVRDREDSPQWKAVAEDFENQFERMLVGAPGRSMDVQIKLWGAFPED